MALDLPDGSACFVDSNILYYALVPTGDLTARCISFLNRALAAQISLAASVSVLSDVLHKVMITEVAQVTKRDRAGMIGYLNKHPDAITSLTQYPKVMERLSVIPMTLLPVDPTLLESASSIAVQQGLLTSDSMIVALMRRHQLEHLVTNDDDFDRVPGLSVWKPR